MNNYRELNIWKKSRKLVKEIYLLTNLFPSNERFGLVDQLRRAAISIPSNIAEGTGRNTKPQTIHFMNISFGSLCEVETQIILSSDLNFITEPVSQKILTEIEEIKKMTWSFIKSIERTK